MATSTTETDLLVTELVLIEKGYEDVPRKVEQSMGRVDAANKRGTDSVKRLQKEVTGPEATANLGRMADEAKRTYDTISAARSRMSSGAGGVNQGGRKVATVGHLNWLMPEGPSGHQDLFTKNQNTPFVSYRHNLGLLGKDIRAAFTGIKPSIDWGKAKAGASKFADDLKANIGDGLSALNPLKAVGVGIGAMAAAATATGFALMSKSADFDSLVQSLNSIEGSSKKARKALDELKVLARAPGLGFEEAVGAYSGLRNAELDEKFSKRIIKEFANANARGGGGVDTFGRIMLQTKQAANRSFLSNEDLTPMAEAGIPIFNVLKKAFGTSDTEELKRKGISAQAALHGIVDELAKLPRVAGGYRNSLDNLADAMKFAEVAAGNALNNAFLPMADDFSKAIQELSEGGVVTAAFETAAQNIRDIFDIDEKGMKDVLAEMLVGVKDMSTAARNLALNTAGAAESGSGAWQWASDTLGWAAGTNVAPWDSEYAAWRKAEDGQDLSARGEYARNAKDTDADMWLAASGHDKEGEESLQAAKKRGYKGTTKQWMGLKQEERDAWLGKGGADQRGDASKTKPNSPEERTARALEQLVAFKKRQMDIQAASAGGGELARLGVTPVELSGSATTSRDRLKRQIADKIDELSAWHVSNRQAGDARHSSRTY